ncbi:MAG: hypothetical protein A4E53_00620 [Pelotomaculum sp. PtaB.Bin104]|nr:MAG: hypothetical protein A4E53_00620 [Pelotomaculum sp. PtaB.Bin104]
MAVDTALPSLEELQEVLADELGQEQEQTFAARLAVNIPALLEQMEALDIKERLAFFKDLILPETAWLEPLERDNVIYEAWRLLKPVGVSKDSIKKEVFARIPKDNQSTREFEQRDNKLPAVYDEWKELLAKTRYCIENSGFLCYMKHLPDGGVEPVTVSNFIARPIKEITRDDGIDTEKMFEITGLLAGGIPLQTVTVPAKEFAGMGWVVENWGLSACLEPGANAKDRVRHAIQSLAHDIPHEKIYVHTGWRKIENKWVFLHSNGAVGAENITVDLSVSGLNRYTLPDSTDDDAVEYSLKLLEVAPMEVTIPLFSLVYLAPLSEPLRQAGIEPAFVLWLVGLTGSLKSTIAALFLSHYGEFVGKNLPASFRDTPNSLEKKGFLVKDCILVVDDFYPSSSSLEAQKMKQAAQQILRMYGDRTGRSRMRADTNLQQTYAPRSLCCATGEDCPDSGQSTTARFLAVDLKRDDIDIKLLGELQANTGKLSQSMRGYLEWLAPRLDDVPEKLKKWFVQYRQKATEGKQHARLPEVVSWLFMGLVSGLDYAKHTGAINEEIKKSIQGAGWQVLMRLAEQQSRRIVDERPAIKFLAIISELLVSGAACVYNIHEPVPKENEVNFIGWKDERWFYLLPDTAYKIAAQFCSGQGGHFPVTARTLWKNLDAEGLIFTEKNGTETRRLIQKRIGGEKYRVLQLDAAALKNV